MSIGLRIWDIGGKEKAENLAAKINQEIISKEKEAGVLLGGDMHSHSIYAIRFGGEYIEFEKCNITKWKIMNFYRLILLGLYSINLRPYLLSIKVEILSGSIPFNGIFSAT